jgi:hypothetical protein
MEDEEAEVQSSFSAVAALSAFSPPKVAAAEDNTMESLPSSASLAVVPSSIGRDMAAKFSNFLLRLLVTVVKSLHARFARYDDVDGTMYAHFENDVVPHAPAMTKSEASLVTRSSQYDSPYYRQKFKRLANTVREPVSLFQKIDGDGTMWGKAVGEIDAPASKVFSWLWNVESYERKLGHIKNNGAFVHRQSIPVPNSHSLFFALLLPFGGVVSDRIIAIWLTWHIAENGDIMIAFTDIDECDEHQEYSDQIKRAIASHTRASKTTMASFQGLWRIKPIALTVCRATYMGNANLKGKLPLMVMNANIKNTLNDVKELQDKFLRNGAVVDADLRSAFLTPPTLEELSPDQTSVVRRCLALETEYKSKSPIPLHSSSPLVDMWIVHTPPKRGEKSIALGMAKGVVDCSAREAAACLFAVCSRVRMRIDAEEGNLARLIASESTTYDIVFATIKRMPFPLNHREFVLRQICFVDGETGSFIVVGHSVDDNIDYGSSIKAVRGTSKFVFRIMPLSETQCSVTFLSYFDAGGNVPAAVTNSKITSALDVLTDLREVFQRDDEVDEVDRNELARVIRDDPQEYTDDEKQLIRRVMDKLVDLEKEVLVDIESPDHQVQMSWAYDETAGGVGRATAVVDGAVEDCASWELSSMSREQTKNHRARRGLERSLIAVNQHCYIYNVVLDLQIPGFQPREWLLRQVWKWREDSKTQLDLCVENHGDPLNYPLNPKYVRAKGYPHLTFEKLEPIGQIPQTRVTYTQGIDVGGSVPKWIVSRGGVRQLMKLSTMRKRFDKSQEIDAANRARIVAVIKNHAGSYSDEENMIVEEGETLFIRFKENRGATLLKMSSPLAIAKVAFKDGDPLGWGWARTTIRAEPEEVQAFIWDTLKRSAARGDDLEKSVDETLNSHNQLVYVKKAAKRPLSDREFLSRAVWKATASGFTYVLRKEESDRRPFLPGVVRGALPSVMKLMRLKANVTTIEYVVHPDAGGSVPSFVMNLQLAKNLQRVTEAQEYFQSLRRLVLWDSDDSKAVGEVMVIRTKEEEHREKGETKVSARMRELFKKYKGLKEIGEKYEFFQGMMTLVVENKLRSAGDVSTRLCNVSKKEGRTIGGGLALSLVSNLTAEAAVDEWIGKYPALRDLDETEIWFRPMINVVALRRLGEVSWGLKMRVFMGAGLSMLDLGSDINVIMLYIGSPDTLGYGISLLGMLSVCMFVQLLAVYAQYKTKPLKLLKEMLLVFTGLKPG